MRVAVSDASRHSSSGRWAVSRAQPKLCLTKTNAIWRREEALSHASRDVLTSVRAALTASCSGRPKKARLDEGPMMDPAAGCIGDEACTCADVRVSTQCAYALAPPLATVDTGRGLDGADRGCPASASSQTPLQLRAPGKFFFDSVEEEEAAEQAKIRPIARAGGRAVMRQRDAVEGGGRRSDVGRGLGRATARRWRANFAAGADSDRGTALPSFELAAVPGNGGRWLQALLHLGEKINQRGI